jgi:hypothetical protein
MANPYHINLKLYSLVNRESGAWDASRSTGVGAFRRAVKLPCRNLLSASASPATATTSARCPHINIHPAAESGHCYGVRASCERGCPALDSIAITRLVMLWRHSRSLETTRIRPNILHINPQRVTHGVRERSPSILRNQ